MLFRSASSRDERYLIVEVVCRDEGGEAYEAYLDGLPVSKTFLSEAEAVDIESKILDAIASGRLTVENRETRAKRTVTSVSVRRIGRLIRVELHLDHFERHPIRRSKHVWGETSQRCGTYAPRMFPIPLWRMSQTVKEYVENGDLLDFLELLESVKPLSEERGITEFDGKTIHPISTRTIFSEFKIYSKGLVSRRRRDCRTLILLDRSLSMANPWSVWDEIPKMRIGQFLVKVIETVHFNNHIFSFGRDVREEDDPYRVKPVDGETRLDLALKEADLYSPERLIVITDGRPLYSTDVSVMEMSQECIYRLDSLARSGIKILIIMLGRDPEMLMFYEELSENPKVSLLDLSAENHGLIKMVYAISRYIYG